MTPEETLLHDEAEQARQAIARTLTKMRSGLSEASDLNAWAKTHPWVSVGVAAATGFAAAAAAVPERGEHAIDKWNRLFERFAPQGPQTPAKEALHATAEYASRFHAARNATPQPASTSVWDAIFELAKIAVANIIVTLFQQQAMQTAAPQMGAASPGGPRPKAAASRSTAVPEPNGKQAHACDTSF